MKKKNSATDYVPLTHSLRVMQQAVQSCKGCDLYKNATQAVFGEGKSTATILFVGEQPGDQEDLKAIPSSGPRGGSWIRRWTRRVSTTARYTLQMP